jgi:hypothetical protein
VRRAAIVLGLAAFLATSCGDGELPTRLAASLQDRVATIREFAENGQPGLARNALRNLVTVVSARLESGVIDDARAAEIIEAAQDVADQLALVQRSSPATSSSPPPVEEDEGDQGEGKPNKGKGNGNGGDGGQGNDD